MMKIKSLSGNIMILLMVALLCCKKTEPGIQQLDGSPIFIPQASLLDGGATNYYPVPFNENGGVPNYIVDADSTRLEVVLGVSRSGPDDAQAYSVSVQNNLVVLQQQVNEMADAVALPADLYSFPKKVEVPEGGRTADFNLTVNYRKLLEKYPHLYDKKLLVALSLYNPSRYTVEDKNGTVVLVINAASFMPIPPEPQPDNNLIKGSEFNAGDEAHWNTMKQNVSNSEPVISFSGGKLRVSTPGQAICNYLIYQAVEVEQDKKYKLSGDVTTNGYTNGWFEFYLHPNAPVLDGDYNPENGAGRLIEFDGWTPGCLETISGKLEDLYCSGPGVSEGSVFTSKYSGTVYFVMKIGAWEGKIDLELDNLKILKLD
ncbi:MAG: hypothetical protein QM594_21210 [Niabella sp.]